MKKFGLLFLTLFTGTIYFSSCSENDESPSAGTAYMAVRLTDTTANYDSVNIDIQAVEVKGGGGTVSLNVNSGIYNLLDFTNGHDTLIASAGVPAGTVSQIRLILGPNNYVVVDGVRHDLSTPSAEQSGLKLNLHETLLDGMDYTLLLDFDASRSIVITGNGSYILKPVIRTVSMTVSGSIAGDAMPEAALPVLATAFNNTDTLSSFTDSTGHFLIRGVPAGSYTLILTPQLPYVNDTINNVSVTVGNVTNVGTVTF